MQGKHTLSNLPAEPAQTERLSRRAFLTLLGTSSAALALAGYTRRRVSPPALAASASATSTFDNYVFLPTVSKACTNPCTVFEDDFNAGLNDGVASSRHWNAPSLCQYGATVEVVPDPTGSVDTRGQVLKVTAQTPVELPWGPGPWQAGYPCWINFHANGDGYVSIIPGSAGIQVDVFVDTQIDSASLLSVHRMRSNSPISMSVAALEIHNHGDITVLGRDDNGYDTRVQCLRGLFRPGEWNTLMLVIDVSTGRVLPFINGRFALSSSEDAPIVPVNSVIPGSFSDGHPGINFHRPPEGTWPMIPASLSVLNGNFMVFEYQ
jgi:hypothetical protein